MHEGTAGERARKRRWVWEVGALVGLVLLVVGGQVARPNYSDFPAFYMAGAVAAEGAWEALYPVPKGNEIPGEPGGSEVRARYQQIADERGVSTYFRYIHSVPLAVGLMPLGWLPISAAHWVWLGVLAVPAWWTAVVAGWTYTRLAGRESWRGGLLVLVLAVSPMSVRAVRTGNVTPIVAACIAMAVLDLLGRRPVRGGAGMAVGALVKYATLVLTPLHVVMGRWRALGVMVGATAAGLAVTVAVAGTGPFEAFARDIAPSLGRPYVRDANQALQSVVLQGLGEKSFSAGWSAGFRAVQWGALGAIVWLLWRRRREMGDRAELVLAGATALVGWLLIFSPVYWPHYPMYLFPMWGWLVWEGTRSRWAGVVVGFAAALSWAPLAGINWLPLGQPVASHLLWATMAMVGVAVWRLAVGGAAGSATVQQATAEIVTAEIVTQEIEKRK